MITVLQTLKAIKYDLPNWSLKSCIKNYLFNAGFRVLLNHRIGKYLYNSNFMILRQIGLYYRMKLITKRNCDISYGATIGRNVRLPHPIGIVIGDGVIIKDNVKIWQQVTLGSHGKKGEPLSYPTIEKNVRIFAGAKIFGNVIVNEYATIGANAVVNKSIPENSVAVGIPCKIINK